MVAWGKDTARPNLPAERAVIFNACTLYSVSHNTTATFAGECCGLGHAHPSSSRKTPYRYPRDAETAAAPSTLPYRCAVPRPSTPDAGKRRAADQQPRFEISHRDGSPRNRSALWRKDVIPARSPFLPM
ncbi:hypothetical protein CTAM01_07514 [Colletotrichum tamarilloi]|uniref:Uncharacterized protein n=1 Tax=Colletotrichum tamarilloi TaxID=1209934 RepID=A0ABQ9R8Z4_9PEZI|nr:uncharacterized protein CTAM01_07514 [Colletotrichum tamarilloi]KAK1498296.1 hypothetical protein CTAM01_07514 [Colletotrichum tamarilloi]